MTSRSSAIAVPGPPAGAEATADSAGLQKAGELRGSALQLSKGHLPRLTVNTLVAQRHATLVGGIAVTDLLANVQTVVKITDKILYYLLHGKVFSEFLIIARVHVPARLLMRVL